MTDQFCMCGTQPGYLHTETCPFPFYGQSDVTQARWIKENIELVKERKCKGNHANHREEIECWEKIK